MALISKESLGIRNAIIAFEKRIDDMHFSFGRYRQGEEKKMPDWEKLEKDILVFSRKKIYDLELSKQLDRIMYKFQNRKKIWLSWAEEFHHKANTKKPEEV